MKILQVNKFYYPKVGGIERVVKNIAEGLPDPYDTSVLAARTRGIGTEEEHNGIEVKKASSLGVMMSVPLAPSYPYQLRAAASDTDIIHHHLPNPLSTVSQLLSIGTDSNVVATYHSDIVRQSNALQVYRPILDRFLESTDRIIVTSQPLLENSDILEPYTEKCDVVPLSIDLDEIDSEELPEGADERTRPTVLFVGRLNYYKGVEYLIDAMQNVDAKLLIAGDGERRSTLEQRTYQQGVSDKVDFLGYVPDEDLGALYRRSDVFVLPSVEPSEAFGIVQLEAMARGVPVINTALPTGVPWVSVDGETGLTVPPRDAGALANGINTLLEDDQRRRRYGQQARARVEALFTRERMITEVQSIYDQVTAIE
ncbi:glycosyltransferase [Haloarchaeobius iranensis]|uniref:Rhamnosyl/mannosyltransferase n=1 Tax=Haloarchaeobius iranensis TaxID=996166 RepID=A0A1H0C5S7_9EURY|nr:glycosyltransferase [Haloarchaeobius iranensis]SDN53215.1 rhamnosyl/mannosyltransferase [Haloarchaeobius iranensis]